MAEKVTIGNCELWHGDCREILPTLPGCDLILTDPPYGIGCDATIHATKPDRPSTWAKNKKYENLGWDTERPEQWVLLMMLAKGKDCIFWGGNYFADALPPARAWLFWDKMFENTTNFSHGELAWTSLPGQLRKFTISSKAETRGGQDREHPTQKPVALIDWALSFAPAAQTICDPYMGSGTTGVAAVKMGKAFVGIERERQYFDVACRRIEQAYAQPRLFEDAKVGAGDTAVQGDMLLPANTK